MTIRTLV